MSAQEIRRAAVRDGRLAVKVHSVISRKPSNRGTLSKSGMMGGACRGRMLNGGSPGGSLRSRRAYLTKR